MNFQNILRFFFFFFFFFFFSVFILQCVQTRIFFPCFSLFLTSKWNLKKINRKQSWENCLKNRGEENLP